MKLLDERVSDVTARVALQIAGPEAALRLLRGRAAQLSHWESVMWSTCCCSASALRRLRPRRAWMMWGPDHVRVIDPEGEPVSAIIRHPDDDRHRVNSVDGPGMRSCSTC